MAAEMEDYSANWQAYRKLRNLWWLVFLAYTPGAMAIALLGNYLFGSFSLGYAAAMVWIVAFVILGTRLNTWPCPRCGKWFCATWWYSKSFFARKCVHCGLPKYANSNPDATARG